MEANQRIAERVLLGFLHAYGPLPEDVIDKLTVVKNAVIELVGNERELIEAELRVELEKNLLLLVTEG